jgi:tetratricopeptide (TPR) repeat protein
MSHFLSLIQQTIARVGIARVGIARVGIARVGIARAGIARAGVARAVFVRNTVTCLAIAWLIPTQAGAQAPGTFALPHQITTPAGQALTAIDPSYQAQMAAIIEARRVLFQGDLPNAIQLLQSFCAKYPNNSDGHFWLAIAQKQANDLQAAENEYALSLESAKNDGLDSAELRNNLGNLLIQMDATKFVKEAEYNFQRAIEIDPDLSQPHENLGRLLLIQGRYPEALQELNTSNLSAHLTGRLCLLRALAYLALSNQAEAKAWLERCMDLSARNQDPVSLSTGQKARELRQMLGQ